MWRTSEPELNTDPDVDMQRYMGVWYELARSSPVILAHGNDYSDKQHCMCINKRGDISVQTSWIIHSNPHFSRKAVANGNAREITTGKIHLSYYNYVPLAFLYSEHWILKTDHSSFALVGDSARQNISILSRTQTLDETLVNGLLHESSLMGFDVSNVTRTQHYASVEFV